MAKIILTGDGQSFDVEDEIAKDDGLLRSVVKSISPAYTTPIFRRETKGDILTVHVSKQAGTKGAGALDTLINAPETINPVEAMRERMDTLARKRRLSVKTAIKMEGEVRAAITASQVEQGITTRAISILLSSEGVASDYIPIGF
ncbi:MAG: hypothetical protein DMF68_16070 [Acidobacteria bacterium]|nr:MAG: hypothetical protein DMF68_16070 [Acidobacteriota bacterium]